MQVPKEIVPRLGKADQVGLRLKCSSQLQAETIHRELRHHFPRKVTGLMRSTHPDFTHFVFVTTTETQLQHVWVAIETVLAANAGTFVAEQKAAAAQASADFKTWERKFRSAVKHIHEDKPPADSSGQTIGPEWIDQQIIAGRIDEAEDILLGDLQPAGHTLRGLITLYARSNQHEKIIQLYETRRDAILALPVSDKLVEQLVTAYIAFAQHTEVPDARHTAQQIARIFLPELERLRQADGVRRLLRQTIPPSEPAPVQESIPLTEQLADFIEIEPAERLLQLEELQRRHPNAASVQLTLASTYAALGDTARALDVYRTLPEHTPAEQNEALQRSAELLLAEVRYQEVLKLLPDGDLSPPLAGLRGAALYGIGQQAQAQPLLEQAWAAGDRGKLVLLYLARLRSASNQPEGAAEPYRMLLETAADSLEAEDYAQIALIAAYSSGFGEVTYEQLAQYGDAAIQRAGFTFSTLPLARDVLEIRKLAADALGQPDRVLAAYADWMEWLAQSGDMNALEQTLAEVREQRQNQHITPEQHFTLLEGMEPFTEALPALRQYLANEYQGIATSVIDRAFRDNQSFPAYIQDIQRALHFLDRTTADFIRAYIESERQALAARNEPVPEQTIAEESPVDLSATRLALVGGHEATRREVIRELRKYHGVHEVVEVAPSSTAHIDQSSVQAKLANVTLIAVITGYMGHDLSSIVRSLQQAGNLTGQVLWLACRGKRGVVREILATVRHQNLPGGVRRSE